MAGRRCRPRRHQDAGGRSGRERQDLGQAKRATKPEAGVEAVVERIAKTVRDAVSNAELSRAISPPSARPRRARSTPNEGVVRYRAESARLGECALRQAAERSSGRCPAFIENDVNLGTLGEYGLGAGQGHS